MVYTPDETLPQRLLFLLVSLVTAASLVFLSIIVASTDGSSNFESTMQQKTANVTKNLRKLARFPGRVSKFAASVTSLDAFISPARNTSRNVPVITPLPALAAPANMTLPAISLVASTAAAKSPPTTALDLYAWGNCTWWAAHRRAQINDPVPNSWGNATTWASMAARSGYIVNHQPSPGAIMQLSGKADGLGHVAFVESVDKDGTWNISEMNVMGLNVVDHKAEPPSAAVNFNFIHDKV